MAFRGFLAMTALLRMGSRCLGCFALIDRVIDVCRIGMVGIEAEREILLLFSSGAKRLLVVFQLDI